MAKTDRAETARRTAVAVRNNRGMYVDGNTARRLQEVPRKRTRPAQQNRKRVRPAAKKSEEQVTHSSVRKHRKTEKKP